MACDQVMEQTFNRDSKTKGGITGFSLNRSAVKRWILSQSERGSITRQCHELAGLIDTDRLDICNNFYLQYSIFDVYGTLSHAVICLKPGFHIVVIVVTPSIADDC